MPFFGSDNISVIYFETPVMANGSHTITGTITSATFDVPYVIDYFYINPPTGAGNAGDGATQTVPSSSGTAGPTTVIVQSTPIGAIVGGIVGGIAGIAILLFAAYFFLIRRPRDRRADYPDRAGADNFRAGEGSSKFKIFKGTSRAYSNSRRSGGAILCRHSQPYQLSFLIVERKNSSDGSTLLEHPAARSVSRLWIAVQWELGARSRAVTTAARTGSPHVFAGLNSGCAGSHFDFQCILDVFPR